MSLSTVRAITTRPSVDCFEALSRALPSVARAPGIAVVHVPAPLGDAFSLLDASLASHASVFRTDDGVVVAGVGETARVVARGPERFARLRDETLSLLAGAIVVGEGPAIRFYGGGAFAPGSADEAPWDAFGDASFVLPRWTYRRDDHRATISLATLPGDCSPIRHAGELRRLLASIERPAARSSARLLGVEHEARASYAARVDAANAEIAAGRLRKVVVARRSDVLFDDEIRLSALVRTLAAHQPECTTFAIREGSATFMGATPELLLSVRGRSFRSLALAGFDLRRYAERRGAPSREREGSRRARARRVAHRAAALGVVHRAPPHRAPDRSSPPERRAPRDPDRGGARDRRSSVRFWRRSSTRRRRSVACPRRAPCVSSSERR